MKKIILIFIVCIIIYLSIHICFQWYKEISKEWYNDTKEKKVYKYCNSMLQSDSQGLVNDAMIVCEYTKELPATPFFFYEIYDKSNPSDWIFVNLDVTDFEKLFSDKKAPHTVVCKNHQTFDILKEIAPEDYRVIYTGFTSIDRYNKDIKKDFKRFIHIAGNSKSKGTIPIVQSWIYHPEYPTLIIICRNDYSLVSDIKKVIGENVPENIIIMSEFIDDKTLNMLQNYCGIHLCVSEYEGFGHNVNESRSVASVALYTPCMNEKFIDNISGIAVKSKKKKIKQNKLCDVYETNSLYISEAVEKVLNMNIEELQLIGQRARESFLQDDAEFKKKLHHEIIGKKVIPHIIHMMWISKDEPFIDVPIPEKNNKYIDAWKQNNTDFEFMHWSGKNTLNLIETYFPEYLEFYKKLSPTISKCDFARFAIVAIYGGVYVDIDFYCRKNIGPLLIGENLFYFEPKEHMERNKQKFLFNGFFACCKNDPFVRGWLKEMSTKIGTDVMENTGPTGLYKYYTKSNHNVNIGNTCHMTPIIQGNEVCKDCKGFYNTYMTTFWDDGSGWGGDVKYTNFITIKNPIDDSDIQWEENTFFKQENEKIILDLFEKAKQLPINGEIHCRLQHSILLASALLHINRQDIIVYTSGNKQAECDFIEKMALLNTLPNISVQHIVK